MAKTKTDMRSASELYKADKDPSYYIEAELGMIDIGERKLPIT